MAPSEGPVSGVARWLDPIVTAFEKANIQFALVGGLAMATYGFPRATVDIDFLIAAKDIPTSLHILEEMGFTLDIDPMVFCQGKVTIHRRTGVFPGDPDALPIDLLVLSSDEEKKYFQEILMKPWGNKNLPLLSVAHFIALKKYRNSKIDQADIEKLEPPGEFSHGSSRQS